MLFEINSGSQGFWRLGFPPFYVFLKLFRKMMQHCFTVKLQKCLVDEETSPSLSWGFSILTELLLTEKPLTYTLGTEDPRNVPMYLAALFNQSTVA